MKLALAPISFALTISLVLAIMLYVMSAEVTLCAPAVTLFVSAITVMGLGLGVKSCT